MVQDTSGRSSWRFGACQRLQEMGQGDGERESNSPGAPALWKRPEKGEGIAAIQIILLQAKKTNQNQAKQNKTNQQKPKKEPQTKPKKYRGKRENLPPNLNSEPFELFAIDFYFFKAPQILFNL